MWLEKPCDRDPSKAELAYSAVTVRGRFSREDVIGVCPVAQGLILGFSILPPCSSQTLMVHCGGGMSQLWPGLNSKQCAQAKDEKPELH